MEKFHSFILCNKCRFSCRRNKKVNINFLLKIIWPAIRNIIQQKTIYANIIDIFYSIEGEVFNEIDIPDVQELFEDEEISGGNLVDLVLHHMPESTGDSVSDDDTQNSGKTFLEE